MLFVQFYILTVNNIIQSERY